MRRVLIGLLLIGAIGTGGVGGGFVHPGDPTKPWQLGMPETGVINSSVVDYDAETAEVKTRMYVDNPNPIGVTAPEVVYRLYWNEERKGPYEYLGEDTISNVTVAPQANETLVTNTTVQNDEAASFTATLQNQGYAYVRVEGQFMLRDGRMSANFERVVRVED